MSPLLDEALYRMTILGNPLIYCITRFCAVLCDTLGHELKRPKYPAAKQKSGREANNGYISNPVRL
jgi:hypothetical protein